MRLFLHADGSFLSVQPDVEFGAPPVSLAPVILDPVAGTFDFDTATNPALADDIVQDFHVRRTFRYRVTAGALTRDSAPVTVNPPGQFYQDRDNIQQALGQLDTFLQSLDAGQNLTAAQVQQAIKFLLRFARYVLRWMLRHG
jgi:hypothetical protein